MLKLYGQYRSRAFRVAWLCKESGIPYEHVNVTINVDGATCKDPAYVALNPNARVPTIDDDGFILSESMAINLYLAKKHKSPLAPSDPKNEALAMQWSLWETDRLDRQVVIYCRHTSDFPVAERKADIADAAWKEIVPAFDALEAALKKSDWLAGPQFSVADLNVASALFRGLTLDLGKWPKVNAWLHKCWDRPAAKKAKAMRDAK
jgi:glutathione S-transferase